MAIEKTSRTPGAISAHEWTLSDVSRAEFLGEGTYAEVFRVKHEQSSLTARIFPRTIMDSKLRDQIEALQCIQHENLADYYGLIDTPSEVWLLRQFASIGSVSDILPKNRFEVRQVQWILACAIKALAYLHENGISHQNIKPSNILLGTDGQVLLADFGTNDHLKRLCKTRVCSESRMIFESPFYLSREALISGYSSFEADIWALGITAIEMLDGVNPYEAMGLDVFLMGASSSPPQPKRCIPIEFRELISIVLASVVHCPNLYH